MEKHKISHYSLAFYSLAVLGVTGLLGGIYYIYTTFKKEQPPQEIKQNQTEEIKYV
jgi:hypothetical protein